MQYLRDVKYGETIAQIQTDINYTLSFCRSVEKTAEETIGFEEKERREDQTYNEDIMKMSEMQKNIRLQMMNETDVTEVKKLRGERKKILKSMTSEIKQIKEKEGDEIVEEIEKTKIS